MYSRQLSKIAISILLLFSFLASSCKHDPENVDIIDPVDTTGNNTGSQCSTDTAYFVQQVLPIFQSSCALSGCHDVATQKEGVILNSFANILSTGEININNPRDSKIYEVLVDDGDDRMPPAPAAALSNAQIAIIEKWISQGAKNNSCIESGCDTTNVKYSTHIKPLIQNTCQGCHSGVAPGGGFELATYAGVKAVADNGKLYGSISHLATYSPMPKNGNKLSDCQITMVKIWINSGAPEN